MPSSSPVPRSCLRAALFVAVACLPACTGAATIADASVDVIRPATPDPWTSALAIARFEDLNPDPHIVEVNLDARMAEWTIAPGQAVHGMTYNGSVPGPLLDAHIGDSVIVHFTNHLAEPTTIHWHGVRVTNDMDGAPMSQMPVPSGGSFDYHFVVPDAGTFWYHPHVHDAVQMEYGLYGPIVVHGDAEPVVDHEGVVMLDDLTLGVDGQIAQVDIDPLEQHSGREGPIQIVNGRTGVSVPIRAGERERWRIINAGSARFYRIGLAGHRFTLLGTDGGPLATPQDLDELLIVPGDRADVLIDGTAAPGTTVTLMNQPYNRGHGDGVVNATPILQLAYASDSPVSRLSTPAASAAITPIAIDAVTPRTITFDEQVDPITGASTFTINGQSYPNVPEIDTRVGTTEVWDLVNNAAMDHPFHLHGFFFQIVSLAGAPPAFSSWEDTFNLRGHTTARIVFRPDNRPGMWMYHCHILEHATYGMMADLNVMP